jgi:hypothetical protein
MGTRWSDGISKNADFSARDIIDTGDFCVRCEHEGIELRYQFIAFRDGQPQNDVGGRASPLIGDEADFVEPTHIYSTQKPVFPGWDADRAHLCPKCENILDLVDRKWGRWNFWSSSHDFLLILVRRNGALGWFGYQMERALLGLAYLQLQS